MTTIHEALANRLGREPTHKEIRAEANRIKAEALQNAKEAVDDWLRNKTGSNT